MKKQTPITLVLIVVLAVIALINIPKEQNIGGEKDEHGCLGAAGYQYCPSTQKCQRIGEEFCQEFKDQFKITNFQKCLEAGNPVMESYPRQCKANGIKYVEDSSEEKQKTYCLPNQRNSDMCTFLWDPVCAFDHAGNSETKPNSCIACQNKNILYYRIGECAV